MELLSCDLCIALRSAKDVRSERPSKLSRQWHCYDDRWWRKRISFSRIRLRRQARILLVRRLPSGNVGRFWSFSWDREFFYLELLWEIRNHSVFWRLHVIQCTVAEETNSLHQFSRRHGTTCRGPWGGKCRCFWAQLSDVFAKFSTRICRTTGIFSFAKNSPGVLRRVR